MRNNLEEGMYYSPGKLLTDSAILILADEFCEQTVMPLVVKIMEYNLLPKELQPEFITLILNSPGGSVSSCFHLIDIMKSSKIPIHTLAQGSVASCAVIALMAGEKGHRTITHNTTIMSHTWSGGAAGKSHEISAQMKEFESLTNRLTVHYQKCTGKSASYIKKNLMGPVDEWMTPKEAKVHGIVDTIKETY